MLTQEGEYVNGLDQSVYLKGLYPFREKALIIDNIQGRWLVLAL